MAIGAFIAGLLLAETEYRRQVEVTIQPFQGLLLGLFFVSVGASLDLSQVINNPMPTIAVAAGFLAVKFTVLFPMALAMGLARRPAAEVATVLSPGGEFALVLIGAAVVVHVVPSGAAAVATVAATLTMCIIPLVVRVFERVASRARDDNPAVLALTPQAEQEDSGHVIVVGFGRVGQLVGHMLAQHNIRYFAIDTDADLVAQERKRGLSIYYGDATRIELLRRCGIRGARGLVVTLDTSKAIEDIVSAARAERPDLTIVARARDADHATRLYSVGVTDAVPETIEASLQLSEAVLVNIGVPMGLVIASIHEKRDEFRRMLQPPGSTDQGRHSIRASTFGASPKRSHE
jgi:CPA2 family monovalent cation:H+ antiporter-2